MIDHGKAEAFARRVLRVNRNEDGAHLAAAYLELRAAFEALIDANLTERKTMRGRMRRMLLRVDEVLEDPELAPTKEATP